MTRKKIYISLSFLLIALAGFSNSKPFPGYYISQKGDTIRCNIDFNDWNINPKSIKVEANNKKTEFGPGDIRGFGVDGYDDYLSAIVQYHTAPVSGKDVPAEFSDSVSAKSFFLKILNRGFYSLYDLVTPERVYLYMQQHDGKIAELVYRTRISNDSLIADQHYKNVILSLFVQEGLGDKYFNRISNSAYSPSEIQSLVKILNEGHGGPSYQKKSSQEFQVQLYVGGIRNSFPTPVSGIYYSVFQFDPSYSVTGGLNLLYSIPGQFKAFKVGLSAGYNGYQYNVGKAFKDSFYQSQYYHGTEAYNDTMRMKNSMIQTNFYLMWLVNPLGNMNCYLKAGISYNFSLNTDVSINESNAGTTSTVRNGLPPVPDSFQNSEHSINALKKNYLAPLFGIGLIHGRHTLEFSYFFPADLGSEVNSTDGSFGPAFKISSMSLAYHFTVFSTKK
jgi:hypothetical protein